MEQDLALLQNISDTLKDNPGASQRTLAKKADISLGMMNAILGRFVERGWIMLTNVNARKLCYAVTPAGIAELAERSRSFVKRTFSVANKYNEVLYNLIKEAKDSGKNKVVLYGKSYIEFLIAYVCKELDMEFVKVNVDLPAEQNAYCIAGEMEDNEVLTQLCKSGCVNVVEIIVEDKKVNIQ